MKHVLEGFVKDSLSPSDAFDLTSGMPLARALAMFVLSMPIFYAAFSPVHPLLLGLSAFLESLGLWPLAVFVASRLR